MTIRHLKIFIAVAETGKMSLAATQFYISQPTVSQVIHELEKYYHVLLFERLSKKLYLTDAGKELLSYAHRAVKEFDLLESHMLESNTMEQMKIGATVTVGNCLISPILNDFAKIRPKVQTYAFVANTSVIEEKLLRSELDVGIVEGIVKSPDLISIPIIDDFLVLACGKNHPFATRQTIVADNLNQEQFVMREAGSGTRDLFERYLLEHRISIQIKLEATCPETMRKAITENNCLAVISVRLLEKEIKTNQICIFYNVESTWNRTFNLVYHKNKHITKAIEDLSDLLYQYKTPDFFDKQKIRRLV